MFSIRSWFTPNTHLFSMNARVMVLVQVALLALVWMFASIPFLPQPAGIWNAFIKLSGEGLPADLATSILTNLEAVGYSIVISLVIVYLGVMPFFRKIASLVSMLRFNGLVGITLFFTILTSSSHALKLSLLIFTLTTWFVTSLLAVLDDIPEEEYEHARTLGMSRWRVVLEVVILGRLDRVLEVLRQNTAIAWVMLTTVEGIVRTEGGIGAMLLTQSKYLKLDEVFAIQITILLLGLFQDWMWGALRRLIFPYSTLATERK